MFMNTFIHILEGAAALLVLLLLFQVTRYYRANIPSPPSSEPEPAEPQTVKLSQPVAEEAAVGSGSEAILNDYIGGFFEDATSAATDIQAFKAPVSPLFVDEKKSVDWKAEEVDEVEEDSIITVVSTVDDQTGSTEKVMTDRVVHAMLDEAKLVCAS